MCGSKATGADIQVMTLPSPLPVGQKDLQGGERGGSSCVKRNLLFPKKRNLNSPDSIKIAFYLHSIIIILNPININLSVILEIKWQEKLSVRRIPQRSQAGGATLFAGQHGPLAKHRTVGLYKRRTDTDFGLSQQNIKDLLPANWKSSEE
jgi:hypothetical protein